MEFSASNVIVILILLVVIVFAVKSSIPHFKGQGACCGGDSGIKAKRPKRLDRVITQKTVSIEGMSCENCSARVQNALNSIDGISARVNLRKKQATVKYAKEIEDHVIETAVADAGYEVTGIK